MATESVSASEFNDLAARYEALERQANNLLAAMSRGRAIRNILMLALLVLVGALSYTIYQMGTRLTSPKFMKELADNGQKRMEKNSQTVQKHLVALYEKSSPVLMKAFQDRAEKDQPKFVAACEKEWPKFKEDFQKRLEERVRDQYKQAVAEMRPQLEEIAPELKSDPAKLAKLEEGLVNAADRAVNKMIVQQVEPRFEKLETNWRTYPAAPAPREGDMSVGEQIIGHAMELLAVAFAKGDALAAMVDTPDTKAPMRRAAPPSKKSDGGKAPIEASNNAKKGS